MHLVTDKAEMKSFSSLDFYEVVGDILFGT